jgi:CheY-like chemotaxis protein
MLSKVSSPEANLRPGSGCAVYKRRILVVDDEECLTQLVAMLLEQTDTYIVLVENSAGKAISAAEAFHPDLILMDITMPSLDGGELASRFRAHPALESIPIVFLTGTVTKEEVAEHAGCIGGMCFLAKPVRPADLIDCVARQLAA